MSEDILAAFQRTVRDCLTAKQRQTYFHEAAEDAETQAETCRRKLASLDEEAPL